MPTEEELLQIEVVLRDSRNTEVIMALDRLVLLPTTKEDVAQAMNDLKMVKAFIENRLPKVYGTVAELVFVQHVRAMKSHFVAQQSIGE